MNIIHMWTTKAPECGFYPRRRVLFHIDMYHPDSGNQPSSRLGPHDAGHAVVVAGRDGFRLPSYRIRHRTPYVQVFHRLSGLNGHLRYCNLETNCPSCGTVMSDCELHFFFDIDGNMNRQQNLVTLLLPLMRRFIHCP